MIATFSTAGNDTHVTHMAGQCSPVQWPCSLRCTMSHCQHSRHNQAGLICCPLPCAKHYGAVAMLSMQRHRAPCCTAGYSRLALACSAAASPSAGVHLHAANGTHMNAVWPCAVSLQSLAQIPTCCTRYLAEAKRWPLPVLLLGPVTPNPKVPLAISVGELLVLCSGNDLVEQGQPI